MKLGFFPINLGTNVLLDVISKSKITTKSGQVIYIAKALYKGAKVCRFITKSLFNKLKVKDIK